MGVNMNDLEKKETLDALAARINQNYEEIDFLNEIAKDCGVSGSRIMGGGFGGCTINLVRTELLDNFINTVKDKYTQKYNICPKIHYVKISNGARKIE
jgi:galactokinase